MKQHIHLLIALALLISLHQATAESGRVIGWGRNVEGQATPSAGLSNVIAVASGDMKGLALRSDGTVTAWGDWTNQPPGLSNVVAIAAGARQNLALLANGTVIEWTWDYMGKAMLKPTPLGLSNVVKLASGMFTIWLCYPTAL